MISVAMNAQHKKLELLPSAEHWHWAALYRVSGSQYSLIIDATSPYHRYIL
jgi:hypothetical protein